jgi:hypothetical protein
MEEALLIQKSESRGGRMYREEKNLNGKSTATESRASAMVRLSRRD